MSSITKPRDPLLSVAKFVVGAIMALISFVGVCVVIGLGAILTFKRDEVMTRLAAEGGDPSGYSLVLLAFVLVAALMAVAFLFMRELFRIIGSVGQGNPFDAHNADRLRRMAWQTIAAQLIFMAFAASVASLIGGHTEAVLVEDALKAALDSAFLALVLFILARVFRVGSQMREELEGTV